MFFLFPKIFDLRETQKHDEEAGNLARSLSEVAKIFVGYRGDKNKGLELVII